MTTKRKYFANKKVLSTFKAYNKCERKMQSYALSSSFFFFCSFKEYKGRQLADVLVILL